MTFGGGGTAERIAILGELRSRCGHLMGALRAAVTKSLAISTVRTPMLELCKRNHKPTTTTNNTLKMNRYTLALTLPKSEASRSAFV